MTQFESLPSFSGRPCGADLLAAVPVSWFCPIAVRLNDPRGFSSSGGRISSTLYNLCAPAPGIIWNVTFLFSSSAAAAWQLSLRPSVRPVACADTCRSESVCTTPGQRFWGVPLPLLPPSSPSLLVIVGQLLHPGENMSVALACSSLHV